MKQEHSPRIDAAQVRRASEKISIIEHTRVTSGEYPELNLLRVYVAYTKYVP